MNERKPVEATVDTVQTAISMLWDWLGREPKAKAEIVKVETKIPAIVVDTKGEGIDDG